MKKFLTKNFRDKLSAFDIFKLGNSFALYYLLVFGALPLAVFLHLPSKYVEYFSSQDINVFGGRIFIYLFSGFLAFILGYKIFIFAAGARKSPGFFEKEWDFKKIPWVFGIVLVLSLFIKMLRILGGGYFHSTINSFFSGSAFYSLIGLLDWLGPIALTIAFSYYFYLFKISGSRYQVWRLIAWGTFIVEFTYGFFSGSRFTTIIPIIIYLLTKHYLHSRSFYRVIVAGLLILLVLMPLQNFYRAPRNLIKGYSVPVGNRFQLEPTGVQQFVFDSSVVRISQGWILSAVFEKTDKFLYGGTFKEFLTSFGPPRFLWKDKPLSINAYGNELGRRIGVLHFDDFTTSISPTIVGDWYMNFGLPGIIFGMFFMGMIFRFIYEYFIEQTKYSLSGVMIYSIVWIQLIKGIEDWVAPVWAGLVKLFIIMLFIHLFLVKKKKA